MAESLVHQTGRPAGFRPFHIIVAVVLAVVWFGIAGFVLTHGRGDQSAVDVYSELPADFTGQLLAKGVQYQGLSSVDATTQKTVLALPGTNPAGATGSAPLVFRTSFTDTEKPSSGGPSFTGRPAIMVVVPTTQGGAGGSGAFVEFVDPTSYQVLRTVSYGGGPSPSSSTSG